MDEIEQEINEEVGPNHVRIFDTTLRDGEQSPGISLNIEEKLDIAFELERLQVDVIEAGFPVASQGDFEAVQAIAEAVDGPVIAGLSRTGAEDIDRAWAAIEPAVSRGGARIHTFIATSDVHMKEKLKMTPEQVMQETARAVAQAKSYTDDVEFSPEDASRSDFDFMVDVLKVAVENGATTLNIPDTVGYAQPEQYAQRIKEIRERVPGDYIISTHCHDDLGLAVANSLAGVMAGARQVEVAINGIGERAGNASLEEVVMNLDTRADYFEVGGVPLSTQIKKEDLNRASRIVSELTGYPVQYNKAIVGRNAFAHESGIHQHGVKNDRETYEHMDPANVGWSGETFVIGKHSGTAGLRARAERLGFDGAKINSQHRRAMDDWADETGRDAMDTDIEQILAEELGEELVDRYKFFPEHSTITTTGNRSTVDLTVGVYSPRPHFIEEYRNVPLKSEVKGGPIHAAIEAFKDMSGVDIKLVEYLVVAQTEGVSSKGEVMVRLANGDIEVTASGVADAVDHASIEAFIAGVNTILRAKERVAAQESEAVEA